MRKQRDGFALLIVLWSLVMLSLLTTEITSAGRSELQLAGNLRRAAAAEAAADGGVSEAVFHVSEPRAAWQADGAAHQVRIGTYSLVIRIRDEAVFMNPNTASPPLFAALLTVVGVDPSRAGILAQSVADWRAPGSRDALIQLYRSAGMPAAPTGQPFRSIDELRLVIGMSPDLLARLRPHLSVFAEGPLQGAGADPVIQATLRSLGSGAVSPPPRTPRVLDVMVTADAADGSRFGRHAILRLAQNSSGPPAEILLWTTAEP